MDKDKVKESVRKLTVSGGKTYYVTIPEYMIRQLRWKKGEKKVIALKPEGIFIRDWQGK